MEKGITIPLVPRIEIPPSMPSLGLSVLGASSSPVGTEIVILMPFLDKRSPPILARFSRIIFLGTGFIAGRPISSPSPGFVTVPTPIPPSISMPVVSVILTSVTISAPCVTSGSSPPSLITEHRAQSSPNSQLCRLICTICPLGSSTSTHSCLFWSSTAASPAVAPAAAQVPVVKPVRSLATHHISCQSINSCSYPV